MNAPRSRRVRVLRVFLLAAAITSILFSSPAAADEAPARVKRGDPVPEPIKRQAEVLRAAFATVMGSGKLSCKQRVEGFDQPDCTIEGDKLYEGDVTSHARVYLHSLENEARHRSRLFPTAYEIDLQRRHPDKFRGPPEAIDAGDGGYVQNEVSAWDRERRVPQGGAKAYFLCVNAVTIVTVLKKSAAAGADITQLGEEVKPAAKELAQKLARAYGDALAAAKIGVQCVVAAGDKGQPGGETPPEMRLEVTLDVITASTRREIPFGETVTFPVKVRGINKENAEPVAPNLFAPLQVAFHRDDIVLETAPTDSDGSVTFRYTPPEDTPVGTDPPTECKTHRFKAVASKEGAGAAEDVLEAEITRGPCERVIVRVTREGAENAQAGPPFLFTPTKAAPVRFRVEARVDPERMVKQFRFQLGGPLARFGSMERAAATATPGEYEVLATTLADVILVVAPLADQFGGGTEGGISLDVHASGD